MKHISLVSSLVYLCGRAEGGGRGAGSPSSRRSQVACIIARVYHCSHIRVGKRGNRTSGLSQLARIIAYVYQCSRTRATRRPGRHSSRVSLLAYLWGRTGRGLVACVTHSSRVSVPADLGGKTRQPHIPRVAARAHHRSRASLFAFWGGGSDQAVIVCVYHSSRAS